ncbi:hypothetical protein M3Y97_00377300 [Aphelenchoides bicaudatus]|nr:hypothetical protein M3Y97_00377300 [Aphelenchoides bicaudatus]
MPNQMIRVSIPAVVKTLTTQPDASANVIVQSPPQIVKSPKSVRLQETMDLEFDCAVKGSGQVSWLKNGEQIKPSEYFVVNGNKLNIYGLIRDDQAIYQCFAENEAGNAQASVQLLVYEAALTQALLADGSSTEIREPLGLHAQSVGARTLRLKWDPPFGTTDKLSYSVLYRVEGNSNDLVSNSTTPSLTLVDLEPNTQYMIRVQAVDSSRKAGRLSSPLILRTKNEDFEIGQVRNLKVIVVGADSAQVEWDPPLMSTPKSLRYKFFYRRLNTAENEEEIQSVVVKTSYALHSLRKNAEYSVRVQVVDGSNAGPSSLIVRFQTFSDIPDAPPQNIKLDAPEYGTMRIRWSPPPLDQQNGNLTSYKIRYKTKGRSSKSLIAMANADTNEHKITGLDSGMIYQNGTGPFTEWATIEMPVEEDQTDEVAPAPSELKVFAGYDSIHVSWSPPTEHNVIIQGYSVGWGVYVPDREKANVGPDDRSYTIKGLKPNRDYVISVRAVTRTAEGFPIYETVKTTSYAQPPLDSNNENAGQFAKPSNSLVTPIGVQAESISSSSIRVSWTDPNNAFNQFYSVRYSHSGSTEQTWRYVNTSETEILVEGLQPNTQYEFAVRLIESQQWSMSALTRTQSSAPTSAPRDLTVLPTSPSEREDPHSVTLSWQPPKFANGDVEEYIILYSDRLDLPDREWIIDSAKGDRLSVKITGLLPKSSYYFKIQARNSKGYGPLSPVVTFLPGKLGYNNPKDAYSQINAPSPKRSNSELVELIVEAIRENLLYVVIGTCVLVFFFVLLIICLCRRGSSDKTRRQEGYIAGRKLSSVNRDNGPDCWISHQSNRVELLGAPINHTHELKQLVNCAVDSPPPRYQNHHANGATIPRNYHHSTVSLETRQKTPQIIYTGTNRQHINKIDLSSDRGSSFGGSNTVLQMSSTPPLLSEAGYQTVRQQQINPLRSFVQMNVPPPLDRVPSSQSPVNQPEPRMASVRPVVVASPNNMRVSSAGIRPAGIVIGQRSTSSGLAPVGLAHAQPRVNVASIYSPYNSTIGSKEDVRNTKHR